MNPTMQWVLRSWLGRPLMLLIDGGFHAFIFLGEKFGFAAYEPMLPPYVVDRGGVLAAEANRRGYTMDVLRIGKRRQDTYRLTMSGRQLVFAGVPRVDRVEKVTSGWIDDKWLLKQRLMTHGVPVSRGRVVYSLGGAKAVFASLQKPVIVKPRFGSRGRHTTTHIKTAEELVVAYRRARQLGWPVMVEEHLVGSVYRATCIDGKVVGILAGDPPRVTGDGVCTIRELIEKKNETRHVEQGPVRLTEKLDVFLVSIGYTLDSVLPAGHEIDLSEKIGLSYGGKSREMIDVTHPKLLAEFNRAAAAVADPIIGFDFISTDVTADPDTVRWGIIECNSVPFINLHHDPLEGTPADAAGAIFDYLEHQLLPLRGGYTQSWWLFMGAAVFFAFIPLLWYAPFFADKEPLLIGRVESVSSTTITVRVKEGRTVELFLTPATVAQATPALVGERVMFTVDGVKDGRKELMSLEVLPDRPQR
jgi:D-alanine-D-alanine ligase-like ATP-grasp enzyme